MNILRTIKLTYQKITRGFSDKDTWNLDHSIANYALPRLKRFKEINNGHPISLTEEEWDFMLDEMIYAMEYLATQWEDDWDDINLGSEENYARFVKGMEYFGKHFQSLWW
jgi:hypothetical protein